MNNFTKVVAYCISLPARYKGMHCGADSFIAPGYDWLFVDLHGVTLKDHVVIGKNAWIQTVNHDNVRGSVVIHDNTQIGRNTVISAAKQIRIGDSCLFSYNVSLVDHDHVFKKDDSSPMQSGITEAKPILIGDHTFIGANSFICKGVMLGKHCVVGANSVVTKSFPDYCVIAGNPAKLIKRLAK